PLHTLGKHAGSTHLWLVLEGDSVMGGVGDNDVGFLDSRHHALPGPLTLNSANLALDRWIAFGGLHVFFYFGLRLLDAFLEAQLLKEEITDCQNSDSEPHVGDHVQKHGSEQAYRSRGCQPSRRDNLRPV